MKSAKSITSDASILAEAMVFAMRKSNVENDVIVKFCGQHKRQYSKDVAQIEKRNISGKDDVLIFHLNRDGFYDVLPQALFHSLSKSEDEDGKEMANFSVELNKEEEESRLFFLPFENVLFDKRVEVLEKENHLFKKLISDRLLGLLPNFWTLDDDIPKDMAFRLCNLMPYAHTIVGNIKMTEECFSYVLQEQVKIDQTPRSKGDNLEELNGLQWALGNGKLGINTVSGSSDDWYNHILVHIGPIQKLEAKSCGKNRSVSKAISALYDYFIPMEWDVSTNFTFSDNAKELFDDGLEFEKSYLGINTRL